MTLKHVVTAISRLAPILSLLALVSGIQLTPAAFAQDEDAYSSCVPVGGVLTTNIGAIAGVTNLGPVFGDLAGSVAATILGQNSNGTYNVQHYWVTAAGDTITLKQALLIPTYPTGDQDIVAVPWGNYRSYISGGTGKFANATGYLDYLGMADFHQFTLVLRYRGKVCYARPAVASEAGGHGSVQGSSLKKMPAHPPALTVSGLGNTENERTGQGIWRRVGADFVLDIPISKNL